MIEVGDLVRISYLTRGYVRIFPEDFAKEKPQCDINSLADYIYKKRSARGSSKLLDASEGGDLTLLVVDKHNDGRCRWVCVLHDSRNTWLYEYEVYRVTNAIGEVSV